jgi:hypothetical protein
MRLEPKLELELISPTRKRTEERAPVRGCIYYKTPPRGDSAEFSPGLKRNFWDLVIAWCVVRAPPLEQLSLSETVISPLRISEQKPPRRDTRALSPGGMFGGKVPLRVSAQKNRPHAPLVPMRRASAYFHCKKGLLMNTASKLGPHAQAARGTCPGVGFTLL